MLSHGWLPTRFALIILLQYSGVLLATARVQSALAQPTIRDSAGVRIVEYRSLRRAPSLLRVGERPFLHLAGLRDDAHEELDSRRPWLSATELTNGTIVVNEFTLLKFFSTSGSSCAPSDGGAAAQENSRRRVRHAVYEAIP